MPRGCGSDFARFNYLEIPVAFDLSTGIQHMVGLDTGCSVSLISKKFLSQNFPNTKPCKAKIPIPMKGISSDKAISMFEYVTLPLYVPGAHRVMFGQAVNHDGHFTGFVQELR